MYIYIVHYSICVHLTCPDACLTSQIFHLERVHCNAFITDACSWPKRSHIYTPSIHGYTVDGGAYWSMSGILGSRTELVFGVFLSVKGRSLMQYVRTFAYTLTELRSEFQTKTLRILNDIDLVAGGARCSMIFLETVDMSTDSSCILPRRPQCVALHCTWPQKF